MVALTQNRKEASWLKIGWKILGFINWPASCSTSFGMTQKLLEKITVAKNL
jgi:hypothetical protein